jgi:hypothetical protein
MTSDSKLRLPFFRHWITREIGLPVAVETKFPHSKTSSRLARPIVPCLTFADQTAIFVKLVDGFVNGKTS